MNFIDDFLNKITMYRLVLYELIFLLVVGCCLSLLGLLPFSVLGLCFSVGFLTAVCWITNKVFAVTFKAQTNLESVYISALILALIIAPPTSIHELPFLFWAGVWAMAAKYMLAIGKKHLFNPVAFGVALPALALGLSANWWVGSAYMLPAVLIIGFLTVRKIRRWDLVISFLGTALFTIIIFGLFKGTDPLTSMQKALLDTPLFFFAFVMLTEPLTTPPTKNLRLYYGALVGILFAPQIHLGSIYSTPELALLVGNVFSYFISPKVKLLLTLKEIVPVGLDMYDFVFSSDQQMKYTPGQYLEWTLGQQSPDSRGSRRYFTIASSPTEADIRIGVKFYPNPSSFKKKLQSFKPGDQIIASGLSGDFTLKRDINQKYVFIAGGIGITPFRSIVKNAIDTNQKIDAVLFYSVKVPSEIVYADIFAVAAPLGLKSVYTLTDTTELPANWSGKTGFVDQKMIETEAPDFKERIFYISGPHAMVTAFEKTLSSMGVPKSQIKIDYFPGFV